MNQHSKAWRLLFVKCPGTFRPSESTKWIFTALFHRDINRIAAISPYLHLLHFFFRIGATISRAFSRVTETLHTGCCIPSQCIFRWTAIQFYLLNENNFLFQKKWKLLRIPGLSCHRYKLFKFKIRFLTTHDFLDNSCLYIFTFSFITEEFLCSYLHWRRVFSTFPSLFRVIKFINDQKLWGCSKYIKLYEKGKR